MLTLSIRDTDTKTLTAPLGGDRRAQEIWSGEVQPGVSGIWGCLRRGRLGAGSGRRRGKGLQSEVVAVLGKADE